MNKYLLIIPLVIIAIVVFLPKNKSVTSMIATSNPQVANTMNASDKKNGFTGEKGETVKLENSQLKIDSSSFETNKVKFFNTTLADGKVIYFLVLKDKDGNFRSAANANKQCASYGKGYRQVGEEIECITCNKKYSLTDFAAAQPDCNPFPINAKLPLIDNQIIINSSELETVASLF